MLRQRASSHVLSEADQLPRVQLSVDAGLTVRYIGRAGQTLSTHVEVVIPMQYVTIVKQHPVRGGIIVVEALILGCILGGYLWLEVHPVVGIVVGAGASSFYAYLFTLRGVAIVLATITSLSWALIAAAITSGFGKGSHLDWLWPTFGAALGFYMSWIAHRTGAEELRQINDPRERRNLAILLGMGIALLAVVFLLRKEDDRGRRLPAERQHVLRRPREQHDSVASVPPTPRRH